MNKAAFLNIVRQVAPIQDQEVDDLEKLVVSFPYCQTAHVLLAKAAHDRGSMLSTQKLRRAAAHASNRQLLKQLIYAAPPVQEAYYPEPAEEEIQEPASVSKPFFENEPENDVYAEEDVITEEPALQEPELAEIPDTDLAEMETQEEISSPAEPETEEGTTNLPEEPTTFLEEESVVATEGVLTESEDLAPALLPTDNEAEEEEVIASEFEQEAEIISGALAETSEDSQEPQELEGAILEPFFEKEAENSNQAFKAEDFQSEQDENIAAISEDVPDLEEEDDFNLDELFELIQINGLASLSAPIPSVNLTHEEIISEITSTSETASLQELPELTPQATQLPTTAAAPEDNLSAYLEIAELYTVYDTSGYEFPTLKVNAAEPVAEEPETEQDPYLSIFTQNNLAYWMGSSRLGESIQLKDELTSLTPFYFQPELILEHVKSHHVPAPEPEETPAAKLDKQLQIINQFLKSAPKRKNMANAQLTHEPQEDLSARSSKPKKNLVSENLALIFIKQGKAKKAVKIYEQLIVKFPEKKSYFAEQIEKLRNEL
jgi:hypothetical protein